MKRGTDFLIKLLVFLWSVVMLETVICADGKTAGILYQEQMKDKSTMENSGTGDSNTPVNLQNGLVAYYPFNGNARDESGNKHHGIVHGVRLTADRLGNPRSAYNFNGMNNYIEVTDNNDINFDKTTSFSISLWFAAATDLAAGKELIDKGTDTSIVYEVAMSAGKKKSVSLMVHDLNGEESLIAESSVSLSWHPWNHLVAIVDRENDTLQLYFNDVKVAESQYYECDNYNCDISSGSSLKIGMDRLHKNFFDGDIDDIRIYNRVLNQEEIHELNSEGGYSEPPVVLTWDISEITETGAFVGGELPDSKDWDILIKGNCWSTSPHPDTSDARTCECSSANRYFMSYITGLHPGTKYYLRAYAVNKAGVGYGSDMEFTTLPVFDSIEDIEGNVYKTVQIGRYKWMAENLRTTHYNDGSAIPNVTDGLEWASLTHDAYSWYKNDEATYKYPYGAYYNQYVIMENRNVCPVGWHIATPIEFDTLPCSLDYSSHPFVYYHSCIELKSKNYWGGATNLTGFSLLPAGIRQGLTYYYLQPNGHFNGFKLVAFLWNSRGTYERFIQDDEYADQEWYFNPSIYDGYSIRCVEDKETSIFIDNAEGNRNATFEIPVKIMDLPRTGLIAWQFDVNFDSSKIGFENCSIENTLSSGGLVQSNVTGNNLSVAWAGDTTIVYPGVLLKLRFRGLKPGKTSLVVTNFLLNTDTVKNVTGDLITIYPAFGDIDGNGTVQAYDAGAALQYSVGLDPLPQIDSLPWDEWRYNLARVDSMEYISSFDAALILQYVVNRINFFPVQKSTDSIFSPASGVDVRIEDDYLVFRAKADLFGLNAKVVNGNDFLGEPEVMDPDMISATQITPDNYVVGLATADPADENEIIMRIPIEREPDQHVAIDMLINGKSSHIDVGFPTLISKDVSGQIEVYPNPANTDLYFRNLQGKARVSVYDFQGRSILSGVITGNHLNIAGFDNGLYTLRIEDSRNIKIVKVIKE
jgi:uncharacterized protein (TIGR02145 family)